MAGKQLTSTCQSPKQTLNEPRCCFVWDSKGTSRVPFSPTSNCVLSLCGRTRVMSNRSAKKKRPNTYSILQYLDGSNSSTTANKTRGSLDSVHVDPYLKWDLIAARKYGRDWLDKVPRGPPLPRQTNIRTSLVLVVDSIPSAPVLHTSFVSQSTFACPCHVFTSRVGR